PTGWADYAPPAVAHTGPTGISFPGMTDITPTAQLEYRTTYYNWEAGELRAPVVAVFDPLTPPVSLTSRDGLTPGGKPYVGFGTAELTATGLAPGESS